MGRQSAATLNVQLTNFAQGHMNDLAATMLLAERLAPTVPVPGGVGQYKTFDDVNSFQIYETERSLGGGANRIKFDATDAYYATKPNALEVTVDQQERENAGVDNTLAQQLLDEGKIKALLNSTSLAHVKKVVDFVMANTTAVAGKGVWSDDANDPIDELDEQLDLLTKDVGSSEHIKLDLSVGAWRTIRNHAKVKARVTGSQATPLTRQQLVDSLVIPVDLHISAISYNTAALGQPKSKARLGNDDVLIHYSIPNPTEYDPSAFKVFSMDRSKITSVRTYKGDNSERYDVHAVDWSEDLKQTSPIAIKRINLT